jgi:hypothetical protein
MPKSMSGVMGEFKHHELHSGSSRGPVVHSRPQAIAIGLSEQRQMGRKIPKPPLPHRDGLTHAMRKVGSGGT